MSEEINSFTSPMDISSRAVPSIQKNDFSLKTCEDSGYTSLFSSLNACTSQPSSYLSDSIHKFGNESTQNETSNSTLPGVSTYSEFLMDASLYTEPVSTCLSMDIEDSTLPSTEISKEIDSEFSEYGTPMSSFPTPKTPKKLKKISRLRYLSGFDKLDMLFQLGVKTNHHLVVSKILSFLSGKDLWSMTMVSKSWRKLIMSDFKAKSTYLEYVMERKSCKENLGIRHKIKRSKLEPLLTRNHSTPLQARQSSSPPVSPSKYRFNMFRKEAVLLKDDESLTHCPRCRHAAACSSTSKMGECRSITCKYRFCSSCRAEEHSGKACPVFTPSTPTKSSSSSYNWKRSRRYLRRL